MRTCASCGRVLAARKRRCEHCGVSNATKPRVAVPSGAALLAPLPVRVDEVVLPPAPPATGLRVDAADDADPIRASRCRHCLRSPAIDVSARVTVGVLIAHASAPIEGPFCRACGTARVRDITNRTLWLGWWGPLAPIATLRTLWHNGRSLRRLARLPEPAAAPRLRYAERPFQPGRPVFLRSGMLVLAAVTVVVGLAALLVSLVSFLGPVQLEDRCVDVATDQRSLRVLDGCGDADGRIVEIVTGGRRCEVTPDVEVALPDYANNSRACVRLTKR